MQDVTKILVLNVTTIGSWQKLYSQQAFHHEQGWSYLFIGTGLHVYPMTPLDPCPTHLFTHFLAFHQPSSGKSSVSSFYSKLIVGVPLIGGYYTMANPGNPLRYNATAVSALAHSRGPGKKEEVPVTSLTNTKLEHENTYEQAALKSVVRVVRGVA